MTDRNGQILLINSEARNMLNIEKSNLEGKYLWDYLSNEQLVDALNEVIKEPETIKEIDLSTEEHTRFYQAGTKPVVTLKGEKLGVVTVLRDITLEKEKISFCNDLFTMGGHTGTHLDSKAHIALNNRVTNNLDISELQDYQNGLGVMGIETTPPIMNRGIQRGRWRSGRRPWMRSRMTSGCGITSPTWFPSEASFSTASIFPRERWKNSSRKLRPPPAIPRLPPWSCSIRPSTRSSPTVPPARKSIWS